MAITKEKLGPIRQDITAALGLVAKKHNLTAGGFNIRFDEKSFRFTIEFSDNSAVGVVAGVDPKYLSNLQRYGWEFHLTEKDIGKKFKTPDLGVCEFLGLAGRSRCVIKQVSTGKKFVTPGASMRHRIDNNLVVTPAPAPATV